MRKIGTFALSCLVAAAVACGGNRAEAQSPTSGETSGGDATPAQSSGESGSGGEAPAGRDQLSELEARRVTDAIKADIPNHKAKFKGYCGSEVEIEIDWKSFGRDKRALESLYSNWGVQRLVDSFQPVCRDSAGKEAVKAKVKKIRAVNVWSKEKIKASVAAGTFTAELTWFESAPGMNEHDLAGAITKGL